MVQSMPPRATVHGTPLTPLTESVEWTAFRYEGYATVAERISRLRAYWRRVRVLEGIFAFLSIALGAILVIVTAEGWLHFSPTIRQGLRVVWFASVVVALTVFVLRRLMQDLSDEEFALRVEARFPEIRGYLINCIRLAKDSKVPSPSLVNAAIMESCRVTAATSFEAAVDLRVVKRLSAITAALTAMVVIILGVSPRLRNALVRVAAPGSDIPQVGRVVITKITPGEDVTLVAGSSLEVTAEIRPAKGEIEGALVYRPEDGQWKTHRMRRHSETAFVGGIRDIRIPMRYYVQIADTQSRQFAIRVVECPAVTGIDLRYLYPAYTGMGEAIVEKSDGTIRAVAGTRVHLKVHANKRVSSGSIRVGEDQLRLIEEAGRQSLTTENPIEVRRDDTYVIQLTDVQGYRGTDPVARAIRVIPDERPVVAIVAPGRDMVLPLGKAINLVVRGSDDFGLTQAELVARRRESQEEKIIHAWNHLSGKNVTLAWDWVFDEKNYALGDCWRYYVRMRDNNDVTGPGVGRSAEYEVRLENIEAKIEALKEKYSNWYMRVEQVLKKQRKLRGDTERLRQGPENMK